MKRGMDWKRQEVCCDCGAMESRLEWLRRLPRDWRRRNEEIPPDLFGQWVSESLLEELRPENVMKPWLKP
jgi:hypothetical protein